MQRNDQIRSIIAVVEDNSLEFALQETARGFSQSGKNQWLPPQRKSCSRVKCHISVVHSCQIVYVERLGLYFSYLSSSRLNGRTDSRSNINGLTMNSLPEASLGDMGAGKFQLLFLSVFSCAVSVSLEFSVIFLLSKYTDCPNCRYSLRRDCKISSRSMEMPVFFKTC